jgi:hypothetical protein
MGEQMVINSMKVGCSQVFFSNHPILLGLYSQSIERYFDQDPGKMFLSGSEFVSKMGSH